MNIVIIGDGKIGHTLTEQLSIEGHNMVLIDNDIKTLYETSNLMDIKCVEGNGLSYEVQMEADVPKADLVIATTSTDEMNMLCCLLAKKHGAKHTIARVRTPEYVKQIDFIRDELGLSMTINPEREAATEIARSLIFPSASQIESFAKGRVELAGFFVEEGGLLDGLQLNNFYRKYQIKLLICVVERDDEVFIPNGDFVLKAGDRIHISASHREIVKFCKKIGILKEKVRTVMIVGGSRIAYYLASNLIASGMDVKIIEKDQDRCNELADMLPEVTIIHGNANNQELLKEEGIQEVDALVSLTGIDEENIVLGMFAKSMKVPKNIIKINNLSFAKLIDHMEIGTIISPRTISCNLVVKYVRAMKNSGASNVRALYKMVGNQVEALEFAVKENVEFIGQKLKDLTLRKDLLIACIIRHGRIIIPGGKDTIERDDTVIIITLNHHLTDIREIVQ